MEPEVSLFKAFFQERLGVLHFVSKTHVLGEFSTSFRRINKPFIALNHRLVPFSLCSTLSTCSLNHFNRLAQPPLESKAILCRKDADRGRKRELRDAKWTSESSDRRANSSSSSSSSN